MDLITTLRYDDHVNDLTREMDKHLRDGFPLDEYCMHSYICEPMRHKDGMALRFPGATRGHIEIDENMVITDVIIYEDTGTGRMGCYKDSVREAVKQFIGAKIVIQEEKILKAEQECMSEQLEGKQVAVVGHSGTGRKTMASLLALTAAVQALGGRGAYSLNDMPKIPTYDPIKDRRIYGYIPKNVQGRNERCTCGSGKKYKKCCGKG